MSHLLKGAKFEDRHHVSDMDRRPRRIDPKLHTKPLPREESLLEIITVDDTGDSLGEEVLDGLRISVWHDE